MVKEEAFWRLSPVGSDFFVGNSKWGVRLNEVAYGSGLDYRRRGAASKPMGSAWVGGLMDDGPAIAEILQVRRSRS